MPRLLWLQLDLFALPPFWGQGFLTVPSPFSLLDNHTRNVAIASSTTGTLTALLTPGALGIVSGPLSVKIPVVSQVLLLGSFAALIASAVTRKEVPAVHVHITQPAAAQE